MRARCRTSSAWRRRVSRSISARWASTTRTGRARCRSRACCCTGSSGRAAATTTWCSVSATGTARSRSEVASGSRRASDGSGSTPSRLTRWRSCASDRTAMWTSSVMAPWVSRISPSGSPVRRCSSSARCSSALVTSPLRSSIWATRRRVRRASGDSGRGQGAGVGRVDRGEEVVRVVRDQPHRTGQPLGDHVRGHVRRRRRRRPRAARRRGRRRRAGPGTCGTRPRAAGAGRGGRPQRSGSGREG